MIVGDNGCGLFVQFPSVTSDALKHSGIGKAVMYLYKHPKELRQNKEMAGKLISKLIVFFCNFTLQWLLIFH